MVFSRNTGAHYTNTHECHIFSPMLTVTVNCWYPIQLYKSNSCNALFTLYLCRHLFNILSVSDYPFLKRQKDQTLAKMWVRDFLLLYMSFIPLSPLSITPSLRRSTITSSLLSPYAWHWGRFGENAKQWM